MRKASYLLHSAAGAVLGIFVYLLCFSGTVAIFKEELVGWVNAGHRPVAAATPSLQQRLAVMKARLPEGEEVRRLTFPAGAYGVYELRSQKGSRVFAHEDGS